jgi:hypothetical protein
MLTVAMVGSPVLLGACGSSSKPKNGSGAGIEAAGIRFANCMRDHGVPSFPDPNAGGGGGLQFSLGPGYNPQAPAVRSAQAVCRRLLPSGLAEPAPESEKLQMLQVAECMRSHGVSDFPDPTNTPPPGPPRGGISVGSPGAFLTVREALIQSPAFKHAAPKCGFPGA